MNHMLSKRDEFHLVLSLTNRKLTSVHRFFKVSGILYSVTTCKLLQNSSYENIMFISRLLIFGHTKFAQFHITKIAPVCFHQLPKDVSLFSRFENLLYKKCFVSLPTYKKLGDFVSIVKVCIGIHSFICLTFSFSG